MRKQTAVEWLYELSKERELDKFDLEQAKEMEKQEIKNAFTNGFISSRGSNRIADETFYNETYGGGEQ